MNFQVKRSLTLVATSAMMAIGGAGGTAQAEPVEISFYYPVAIGGPVTKIVDDLITRFEGQNPDIQGQTDLLRHLSRNLKQIPHSFQIRSGT